MSVTAQKLIELVQNMAVLKTIQLKLVEKRDYIPAKDIGKLLKGLEKVTKHLGSFTNKQVDQMIGKIKAIVRKYNVT